MDSGISNRDISAISLETITLMLTDAVEGLAKKLERLFANIEGVVEDDFRACLNRRR